MILAKVRVGTRFVFEDRGGIWEKVSETKARCFFGKREEQEKRVEIDISPETFVFAMFDEPRRHESTGMRVEIFDEMTEERLFEIPEASATTVAALSSTDNLRFLPSGKRKERDYIVGETHVDLCRYAMAVMVRENKVLGREEEEGKQ